MAVAKLGAHLLAKKGAALPSLKSFEQAYELAEDAGPPKGQGVSDRFAKISESAKQQKSDEKQKTVRKSLTLGEVTNARLRLMAAKMGVSQQVLMEKAVQQFMQNMLGDDCICRE